MHIRDISGHCGPSSASYSATKQGLLIHEKMLTSESSSNFMQLPDALTVDMLSRWLEIGDIVRLDSAMCSRQHRPVWLLLFQLPELRIHWIAENNSFRWSIRRQAKFDGCKVDLWGSDFDADDAVKFITQSATTLHSCKILGRDGSADGSGLASVVAKVARALEEVSFYRIVVTSYDLENALRFPAIAALSVTDCVLEVATLHFGGRRISSTLSKLRLTGLGIDDKFMQVLIAATPMVSRADLRKCDKLTDETARAIACSWVQLSWADFEKTHFTDEGILEIAKCCKLLKAVSIGQPDDDWRILTDSAVMALVEHCADLHSLGLDGMYNLTKHAILAAARCPTLRMFAVQDVPDADDACIAALVNGCPRLEILGLPESRLLTAQTLRHIASNGVNIVDLSVMLTRHLTKRDIREIIPSTIKMEIVNESEFDDDGNYIARRSNAAVLRTAVDWVGSAARYVVGAVRHAFV